MKDLREILCKLKLHLDLVSVQTNIQPKGDIYTREVELITACRICLKVLKRKKI